MAGVVAKTSAMFNNGVTSVEVVDSDNDDNISVGGGGGSGGASRSGIKKYLVPSINKFRKLFVSSPDVESDKNKCKWRRHQTNKRDAENEPYYDQDDDDDDDDDDQDDYSDKQEFHPVTDYGNSGKRQHLEEDEDDDEEDQDEDRQVRKKMLKKSNKKGVEIKKKSAYEVISKLHGMIFIFILFFNVFRKY